MVDLGDILVQQERSFTEALSQGTGNFMRNLRNEDFLAGAAEIVEDGLQSAARRAVGEKL